jgi:SAM-dependent methyltransferase
MAGLRQRLRRIRRPARLGGLRRTTPVSDHWGRDRGTPIDRYYIERFLERERGSISGRVLEVLDASYTERFGTAVDRSDVLDIDANNARATIVADLAAAESIPPATFDCVILTQTLQYVYDVEAAVGHTARILKPGGVVLVSLPSVSRIARQYLDTEFERAFGGGDVVVETHGNVLSGIAFLAGLAAEELSASELAIVDPYFPLVITVMAQRS